MAQAELAGPTPHDDRATRSADAATRTRLLPAEATRRLLEGEVIIELLAHHHVGAAGPSPLATRCLVAWRSPLIPAWRRNSPPGEECSTKRSVDEAPGVSRRPSPWNWTSVGRNLACQDPTRSSGGVVFEAASRTRRLRQTRGRMLRPHPRPFGYFGEAQEQRWPIFRCPVAERRHTPAQGRKSVEPDVHRQDDRTAATLRRTSTGTPVRAIEDQRVRAEATERAAAG